MEKNVSVIGGGLVGSLVTLILAQRGHRVKLFEKRHDIRTENLYEGRSINLALSERGLAALRKVGLDVAVKAEGIPMYGRLIHKANGMLESQNYGLHGEYIMSVDRRRLNETLLSAAERQPNVEVFFDHVLENIDLDQKQARFRRHDETVSVQSDLFVGTDGAFSNVRRQIMRRTRMNFQQEYIEHGYKELSIPAGPTFEYQLDHRHLHIWPRQTFMMIALPNQDKSFTVTLFMPHETFDAISTEEQLLAFFEKNFPDALPLIGRERLIADYFKNPTGALVSVKCTPYHFRDCAVILGDAAHAMVPFYGQGMNAGFQDCLVFDELLDEYLDDFSKVLPAYTAKRHPDAVAICDLAMYNHIEMQSKVVSRWFQLQKKTEAWLHYFAPKTVIPLYTMVSFTQIPYAEAVRRWTRQTKWVNRLIAAGSLSVVGSVVLAGFVFLKLKRYI